MCQKNLCAEGCFPIMQPFSAFPVQMFYQATWLFLSCHIVVEQQKVCVLEAHQKPCEVWKPRPPLVPGRKKLSQRTHLYGQLIFPKL